MTAITINEATIKRFKLNSIASVNTFMVENKITPFVISAERTDTSKNIHYHLLVDTIDEITSAELWYNKIYNDEVVNEASYYSYIIKDGNYKLFNNYNPPVKNTGRDPYENLVIDIYENDLNIDEIRIKYPKLYVKHFRTINEMWRAKDFYMRPTN